MNPTPAHILSILPAKRWFPYYSLLQNPLGALFGFLPQSPPWALFWEGFPQRFLLWRRLTFLGVLLGPSQLCFYTVAPPFPPWRDLRGVPPSVFFSLFSPPGGWFPLSPQGNFSPRRGLSWSRRPLCLSLGALSGRESFSTPPLGITSGAQHLPYLRRCFTRAPPRPLLSAPFRV